MKSIPLTPILSFAVIAFIFQSCDRTPKAGAGSDSGKELLRKAIQAHGGIENWRKGGVLHFRWKYHMTDRGVVVDSRQTIDLSSFEAVHTIPDSETRFGRNADGQYWVYPEEGSFAVPIPFWTLTPIYFIGIPFVFDDEQVHAQLLPETKAFQGKEYLQVQVTYEPGAGDSPDDLYVLLIDEETKRVRGAYYTVTNPLVYSSGPLIKKFITLEDLVEVDGVLLANRHLTYSMTDGVIGDQMRSTEISEVHFVAPEQVDFEVPDGARIF